MARTFEIRTDVIDVTPMPTYRTFHKKTGAEIPSVLRGFEYREGELMPVYSLDQRYSPKNYDRRMVGGAFKEYAPGLTSYYIDGQSVTKDEFRQKYQEKKDAS